MITTDCNFSQKCSQLKNKCKLLECVKLEEFILSSEEIVI